MPKRVRGTGGLIKKPSSRFYYGLIYEHGRQRCVSLKTESESEAIRRLAKLVGKVDRQEPLPTDLNKITYENLHDALVASYQLNGRKSLYTSADGKPRITATCHLDQYFAGLKVLAITSDRINDYKLSRQAAGDSNGTINRSLSALKRMFSLARRAGKLQVIPYIEMLPEAPPREGFLRLADFRKLQVELPAHLKVIITVDYFTGCRIGELKNLKWESVDLMAGTIILHSDETKSGKPRVVPLNKESLQLLIMTPQVGPFVFGGQRPLGSFRKSWATATRKAGFPWLHVHDLRRSAIINMRDAGIPVVTAMRISGHQTDSVYRRYSIVDSVELKSATVKLDRFLEAQPETEEIPIEKSISGRVQ